MTSSSTTPKAQHDTAPHTSQNGPDRIADLVIGMTASLVDHPQSLRIDVESDNGSTTLRLYVASDDLGKVIGKQGRTARSLRTILSAIGSKSGHRYTLDILELP